MKTLICGGSGFIGSHFINNFSLKKDNQIVNIDKLNYASKLNFNLDHLRSNKNFKNLKIDITNFRKILDIIKKFKPDLIINFAAETHVDRSIVKPYSFIKNNIDGTFNILEAIRLNKLHVKKKKFIYFHISTDEVYGDVLGGKFLDENANHNPSSPYAASKAAADDLVRAWSRTYDIPYLMTHCSNNYGPYQYPEKFIPNSIIRIISNEKIKIYGDGNQKRDWLYVEDNVSAIKKIIRYGVINNNYNISSMKLVKNISIAKKIHKAISKYQSQFNLKLNKFNDSIEFIEDRKGHDVKYAISNKKIKKHIKWSPKVDLDDGIEKTVRWYLQNHKIWKKIK